MQTTLVVILIALVWDFHPTVGSGLTGGNTTHPPHQKDAETCVKESYKLLYTATAFGVELAHCEKYTNVR